MQLCFRAAFPIAERQVSKFLLQPDLVCTVRLEGHKTDRKIGKKPAILLESETFGGFWAGAHHAFSDSDT